MFSQMISMFESVCECSSPNEAFKNAYDFMESIDHSSQFKKLIDFTIKSMPKKLNTEAELLRTEGNKLYVKGNNAGAILLYTKSLKFATYNGPNYGKALANRSAASYSLGEYEECLKDIESCLKSQYPKKLRHKVQLRQLQCFFELNMADEFYVQVLELYELFKGNETFERLIKTNKTRLSKTNKHICETPTSGLKFNENFTFATDLVKLRYNEMAGRHVIAAKNIKAGSVLFQEKAFIASLNAGEDIMEQTCYHCLKHIPFSSLPCESCCYCLYCSEKCKRISWTMGHRFECPGMILWCTTFDGLPALAFRFVMKGILSSFDEAPAGVTQFGDCIDNYPYANSLVSHFEERTDKAKICGNAFHLVVYLKYRTDFFDFIRARIDCTQCENVELLVGGLLVKHAAQIQCNAFGVRPENNDKNIANAIFPSISMINHSCRSNARIEFDGCIAVIRTGTKEIAEGTEICVNYGVVWNMEVNCRRQYLWDHFNFYCTCRLCTIEEMFPNLLNIASS